MNWLDKSEYPFQSHYFKINNLNYHYIDEGNGKTILFVHGTPSWSFDFRKVIKLLRSSFRCVAVDHIGFGLSDKPEKYDYSTSNHGKTLEQFILDHDLQHITLVVHDFGGPIGFDVALRHPERISNIVILNSWLWSAEDDAEYEKLKRVLRSPVLPFLYRYINFSARFLLPRSFAGKKPDSKILKHYTMPFKKFGSREGTIAFAKSLLTDQHWFETLWNNRRLLSAIPVLVVWGMKDPIIKPSYLQKFKMGFENVSVVELESSGHFPQEEEPVRVAKAISDFLKAT